MSYSLEAGNNLFWEIFSEHHSYEKISKNINYATGEPKLSLLDRIMSAITFAEAGEYETAKEILEKTKEQKKISEKLFKKDNSCTSSK